MRFIDMFIMLDVFVTSTAQMSIRFRENAY